MQKALSLTPENNELLIELAVLYQYNNQLAEALSALQAVLQRDPKELSSLLNTGIILTRLKRFDDAQKAFQEVIRLAPNMAPGYRELALLYLRTDSDLPRALQLADTAVSLDQSAENFFVLSWARDKNGRSVDALAALERAIELAPDNPKYQEMYVRLRDRDGFSARKEP